MVDLDNKQGLLDTLGGDSVVVSVHSLHKQLEQSFHEVLAMQLPAEYKNVKNIVLCGMGGSRFPALINFHLFKQEITVPFLIIDDYHIPGFVDENTLVILSSYSGTTEEVLFCAEDAYKAGAKLISISGGGKLADWAKEKNVPAYVFNTIHNPSQQPRIGFGYSVGANLGLLVNLGMVQTTKEEIMNAVNALPGLMDPMSIDTPKTQNVAKQLAESIYNHYPYYLVSEFLTGVGNAIQNQTNETAKSISSFRVIPELNHHMMEGLKFPAELRKMSLFVLFYSELYSDRIKKRFQVTKEVVEKNEIKTIWHELKGKTKIEQTFELCGLGSYVSMYLAALYEQDPNAIPFVDYFKEKLSE